MRTRTECAVLTLALTVVTCGGEIVQSTPDANVFTDGSTPPPPTITTLRVPAGLAQVGGYLLSKTTHAWTRAVTCPYDGGSKNLYVNAYEFMRTEVTRAMWTACMQESACEVPRGYIILTDGSYALDSVAAPAEATEPVSVTWSQARKYCQHYGGDLPSDAQFTRAVQGDEWGWGIASVRKSFDQCLAGADLPICSDLAKQGRKYGRTVTAVGQHSWDMGPYGHVDLWGNAGEWTRSAAAVPSGETSPGFAEFCQLVDGSADPVSTLPVSTFPRAPSYQYGDLSAGLLQHPPQGATALQDSLQDTWWLLLMDSPRKELDIEPVAYTGFRCAFPTKP